MQLAIVVVLLVGLWLRNLSVVINAAVALGVTFLPAVLERDYRISLSPSVTIWPTLAVLLHAIGILGPYGNVWWWDHVTHTLSAAVVASVGFAAVRVVDIHSDAIYLPPPFTAVFVLLFTLALGVGWEVLEFVARSLGEAWGFAPVLYQYGLQDTILDLAFDAVGATLVALFAARPLSGLAEDLATRLWDRSG